MSHIRTQTADINDLTCLDKAAKHLNLKLDLSVNHFRTFDGTIDCKGKLSIDGSPYEVGLVEGKNGAYDLRYDSFNAGLLMSTIGPNANRLRDEYNAQVAMKTLSMQGMQARRTVKADGSVVVIANA